jgi:predicted lipoprotein with Yx(FWY)xxD motif
MTRLDGTQQVSYNGKPLYHFVGDQKPEDIKGQGVISFGGTWSLATP